LSYGSQIRFWWVDKLLNSHLDFMSDLMFWILRFRKGKKVVPETFRSELSEEVLEYWYIWRFPNINSMKTISYIIRIDKSHAVISEQFKFSSEQATAVQSKLTKSQTV
jgi:hypothetical protein